MSTYMNVVMLNGSLHRPSRTRVLLDAIYGELCKSVPVRGRFVELLDLVPHIGCALSRETLPEDALETLRGIEAADLLVVGCPVFRAGMPGLLKHLFDLADMDALKGKPVLLAASGGSARHTLVIEHQLRPLFAFFQCLTLPVGVYAGPGDICDGQVATATLREHISLSVGAAKPWLPAERRLSVLAA